jgi:hypothetical protein
VYCHDQPFLLLCSCVCGRELVFFCWVYVSHVQRNFRNDLI